VAGCVLALKNEIEMLLNSGGGRTITAALMGLYALTFGVTAWVGVSLWKNQRWAFRWAVVILIAQIPSISCPGFAYYFYTGATTGILIDSARLNFVFELGSGMKLLFSSEVEGFALGNNVIAAISLYLLGKASAKQKTPAAAPPEPGV
jgi:hypothetical protein